MAKVKDELMHHDYDGIQEYDNDLPGWWKNLFYLSIVFAFVYLMYFHVLGIGDSSAVKYLKETGEYIEPQDSRGMFTSYQSPYYDASEKVMEDDGRQTASDVSGEHGGTAAIATSGSSFEDLLILAMSRANDEQLATLETAFPDIFATFAAGPESHGENMGSEPAPMLADLEPLDDAASMAAGKQIWDTQCFTCHANNGAGGIGPNMTDDYWIHGGTFPDIINVIKVGVPAKGMIPWLGTLDMNQIQQVASYLLTFQGTNPPNGKAPEGVQVNS